MKLQPRIRTGCRGGFPLFSSKSAGGTYLLTAAILATSCTTAAPPKASLKQLNIDMGAYRVTIIRQGCEFPAATIKSDRSLPYTHHQFVATSQGTTSGVFSINCLPVVAGGQAQCLVIDQNITNPAALAGRNCADWDNFILTRR